MKRHSALTQLSREHHPALVLAKRAKRMSEGQLEAVNLFVSELSRIFEADLEPHFRLEEELLLPALLTAGQREAVERTLAEHAELRSLASEPGIRQPGTLRRFADVLAEHVRFEERELFPLAESNLTEETLKAIWRGMDGTVSASGEVLIKGARA